MTRKRSMACRLCREEFSKPPPDEGCMNCRYAMARLNLGATVKFRTHLDGFMAYTLVARVGDDCEIKDQRGRTLRNVPVELLERVGAGDDQEALLQIRNAHPGTEKHSFKVAF